MMDRVQVDMEHAASVCCISAECNFISVNQNSTITDSKVYRFDTKVDIVLPTKHCSTDPVISAFSSSHQHRLSSFVSALCRVLLL